MHSLLQKIQAPVLMLACTASMHALEKATIQAKASPSQTVSFNVLLPLKDRAGLESLLKQQQDAKSPNFHKWLTPEQFHQRFDPDSSAAKAIQQELSAYGLTTTVLSPRFISVTGPALRVQSALSTELHNASFSSGKRIVATTPTSAPASITRAGGMILGLSSTIRVEPHHRTLGRATVDPANRYGTAGPYWFTDLKQAYDWPSYYTVNGFGSNIGILMSGGYSQADQDKYFSHEKLFTPRYFVKNVRGGAAYDPNDGGTVEAALDLQQTGGMAPKARITLYSIPDLSYENIAYGLSQIVEDNAMDVVSMSFGGVEVYDLPAYNDGMDYTAEFLLLDDIMAQGNAQGITFIASSGDYGAIPALPACVNFADKYPCGSFQASVEFPASSPHVTGVGGTNLATFSDGTMNSKYAYEQAYFDQFPDPNATGRVWGSGGGNSRVFTKPEYQNLVNTGNDTQRAVPDVSLHMGGCPLGSISCRHDDSADILALDGGFYYVIGTSASAPDFAGLAALAVQRYGGRLGNMNPYIYDLASEQYNGAVTGIYNTNIPGNNGFFSTKSNSYNRVLGVGTVNGKQFLLLPNAPSAGTPQTPSNP